MIDAQPVMIACAPGEILAGGFARVQAPVQSLALLLLIGPC